MQEFGKCPKCDSFCEIQFKPDEENDSVDLEGVMKFCRSCNYIGSFSREELAYIIRMYEETESADLKCYYCIWR